MMYYKLDATPSGEYMANDGSRYTITAARRVRAVSGVNVGYVPFASLQEALVTWGLTAVEEDLG